MEHMVILKNTYEWFKYYNFNYKFDNLLLYDLFSEMYITRHLAFFAIIGFAVSEARQQQHDIGEYMINTFL